MIKVVCFDLDGVYFTPEGKIQFYQSLVRLTNNEEKVKHVLYESSEMLEFVTGKITSAEFLNYLNLYLELSLTLEGLANLWTNGYKINQEVRDYIANLRNRGIKSATCSNNNPIRIDTLEKKFNFLGDFDIKVFSYECGFVKPSKEIFSKLIELSGVEPNAIIYSDDNENRLYGAEELGINTFVYTDFGAFRIKVEKLIAI